MTAILKEINKRRNKQKINFNGSTIRSSIVYAKKFKLENVLAPVSGRIINVTTRIYFLSFPST